MSDRKLLELAVKACQWTLEYDDNERLSWIIWSDNNVPIYRWNPLTDDGDALRLAVKLGMNIWSGYGTTVAEMPSQAENDHVSFSEHHKDEPYAATRRAIVRAAAEIGKGMK